jgi:hypothetical protein
MNHIKLNGSNLLKFIIQSSQVCLFICNVLNYTHILCICFDSHIYSILNHKNLWTKMTGFSWIWYAMWKALSKGASCESMMIAHETFLKTKYFDILFYISLYVVFMLIQNGRVLKNFGGKKKCITWYKNLYTC